MALAITVSVARAELGWRMILPDFVQPVARRPCTAISDLALGLEGQACGT